MVCLLCYTEQSFAQVNTTMNDSMVVEELNHQAIKLRDSTKDGAIALLDSALKIAKDIGDLSLQAVTQYNWAQVHETYGDINEAEMRYLKWFNLRKIQGMREYRWGMTGMREFYTRHLQLDKLKAIDDEWVQLLDAQQADGIEPPYGYQASMEAVIDNLYNVGSFYDAEDYFKHMVIHIDTFYDYHWMQAWNIYWKVETYLMYYGEAYDLEDWHKRWYQSLHNYCKDTAISQQVIKVSYGRILSLDPLKVLALTKSYEQGISLFYPEDRRAHMMGMYFAAMRSKIQSKLISGGEYAAFANDYYETQLYVCLRMADMDEAYFNSHQIGQEIKALLKSCNKSSSPNNSYLKESLTSTFGNSPNPTCEKWLKYIQKKLK